MKKPASLFPAFRSARPACSACPISVFGEAELLIHLPSHLSGRGL